MRATRVFVVVALVVAVLGMLIEPGVAGSQGREKTLYTLVPGWERVFKIDWEVSERRGQPMVGGYLVNDSPYTVSHVRLLVDGLDDKGAVVAQRISWVPGSTLTPFSRVSFEVPAPGRHPKYQVTVFAYDRIESDGRFD
jgi:hypothetical protein